MSPLQICKPKDNVFDRDQIEALIADGRKIVIFNGNVLKVDAWLPYHPGGEKAILHMVGQDATNEVRAFHSASTQQLMLRYRIGRIQGEWENFTPPIQNGVFRYKGAQQHSSNIETEHCDSDTVMLDVPRLLHKPQVLVSTEILDSEASRSSKARPQTLTLEESSATQGQTSKTQDGKPQPLQHDPEALPSLDGATQADIVAKYRQLDQRLRAAGLFDCKYSAYLSEGFRYISLGLLSYFFLRAGWYAISGIFLGVLWHQLSFTVHDAGHMGITHNFHVDSCIGIVIANFLGGLSCCWWKWNHNVHHIVTNSTEHDPDIQHMPFFAVSHRFFDGLRSSFHERIMTYDATAKFFLRYQHYLYYVILTFGRFNLYVLSWKYILLGQGPRKGPAWWHRYLEGVGQLVYWYWFGYLTVYKSIPTNWDRFVFVMIAHGVNMPLHVQLTLSHFAMSTADLGVRESFPQRMLRTTMDVDCPEWLDFFHGGLQFQAVHHLFPRLPRHNLRAAQKFVIEFCDATGIPYSIYGFVEANGKVVGHLGEVARQARILAECQRSIIEKGNSDGH